MINETNVYKSPSIALNPRNYIIGSNFDAENIYIKEIDNDTFAVDEVKLAEEKLAAVNAEIANKKNELIALENKTLIDLEQKKINILREAEEESAKIIQNAAVEIALAKDDGYKEGYNNGNKAAMETVNNETAHLITTLNNIILKIGEEKKTKLLDLKFEIIEIIKKFAEHILNKEIQTYTDDILVANLTELINEVASARELVIKVHPSNVEKIEDIKNQITSEIDSLEKIKIAGASNVDITGCIIETDKGNFDGRLKTKFDSMFECLKQVVEELK